MVRFLRLGAATDPLGCSRGGSSGTPPGSIAGPAAPSANAPSLPTAIVLASVPVPAGRVPVAWAAALPADALRAAAGGKGATTDRFTTPTEVSLALAPGSSGKLRAGSSRPEATLATLAVAFLIAAATGVVDAGSFGASSAAGTASQSEMQSFLASSWFSCQS